MFQLAKSFSQLEKWSHWLTNGCKVAKPVAMAVKILEAVAQEVTFTTSGNNFATQTKWSLSFGST